MVAFQLKRVITSVCSFIDCDTGEFHSLYNDSARDNVSLASEALKVIKDSDDLLKTKLREEPEYKLAILLGDMVTTAPHESGQRFVSVAIILAHRHQALIVLALTWMKHFALKLFSIFVTEEAEEDPSMAYKVRVRDGYYCVITSRFDIQEAVGINYPGEQGIIEDELRAQYFIPPPRTPLDQANFAYDTLWVWANLTEKDWERNADTTANAFRLAAVHVEDYRMMKIYLEEDKESPNTYIARWTGSGVFCTGDTSRKVVFRVMEKEYHAPPPDPTFVRVHAALAKLIQRSYSAQVI
ncbi:hypothetical protein CPC08DRAFT_822489 [Agrocybe pediades]|nr:hypothetical protein CPC08DRAFT_822489 [Agrocybe pediades]